MNLQNSYAVEFLQKLEEQFIDLDSVDSLLKQLIHDIPFLLSILELAKQLCCNSIIVTIYVIQ